jgi:ParB family chromosome partitioning protein
MRDAQQFDMNVESIEKTGLMKPIRVNDKFLRRSGMYELVCGEGRLIAHQRLGKDRIMAEVITCTRKEAYLQSLIENIARTKPGTMDFARELKRLHDEGWNYEQLGRIACRTPGYIRQYIQLVERGEERLIVGVEQGVFPISFAVLVAQSEDENVQNLLMDAFDQELITTESFAAARRIIAARMSRGQGLHRNGKKYTVEELRKDISDTTKAKNSFVREAKTKENRFLLLVTAIDTLWQDREFLTIIEAENLTDRPQLAGDCAKAWT